jgi:hypothetical protein
MHLTEQRGQPIAIPPTSGNGPLMHWEVPELFRRLGVSTDEGYSIFCPAGETVMLVKGKDYRDIGPVVLKMRQDAERERAAYDDEAHSGVRNFHGEAH